MISQPKIVKHSDENWTTEHPLGIKKFYESYYDAVELMDIDPK